MSDNIDEALAFDREKRDQSNDPDRNRQRARRKTPLKRKPRFVDRIRGGKLQKRVRVATKPGHKIVDGKEVRMKASERLARKRGAVRGARKRKGGLAQASRKREISLRRRRSAGLRIRSVAPEMVRVRGKYQ
jgi:hypothetical protein